MNTEPTRSVLISGASIAGPALAYWLSNYGFDVTIVEKAAALRGGGYPVDVRGTALDVIKRMGLHSQLQLAHIDTRKVTFLGSEGETIGKIRPEALTGGVENRDLEVRRGDLAELLYSSMSENVELIFNDSIASLDNQTGGVDVTFTSGTRRTFDVVIGADGLHSRTRRLAFGPEESYHRYLGFCFAGFSMPNDFALAHEVLMWNAPGRGAALYGVAAGEQLHTFLNFACPQPPFAALTDPVAQRRLVEDTFAEDAWEIPGLVSAMKEADDVFFDTISQIHMPRWSRGRVALVGDAAYAPSFLSGQGSSIALVGAYILAGELAVQGDHSAAFAAYEEKTREFVEQNQAIADSGTLSMIPRTPSELSMRNRAVEQQNQADLPGDEGRAANSSMELPYYV